MYPEIELAIFSKNLSKAKIAAQLGMTYNTFLLKLKGKYKFSLDEAVKLRNLLGEETDIETLFEFKKEGA